MESSESWLFSHTNTEKDHFEKEGELDNCSHKLSETDHIMMQLREVQFT